MSVTPDHATATGAVDEVVDAFLAGRLEAVRWDHRAHLLVAHHLLTVERGPAPALARMRPLIQAHNARVGTTGRGYHETITRYFVGAVHHAAVPAEALMGEPALARTALDRHWSPAALASPAAVAGWAPPDRSALAWTWPEA
jgi:hypothetical protein